MQDLNNLIDLVLADADIAHKQHLKTNSYAEHEALGEFYEDVRSKLDAAAEALIAMGQSPATGGENIITRLQSSFAQINELRAICDGVPAAEAIFDEIGATYLKALYKLSRFQ